MKELYKTFIQLRYTENFGIKELIKFRFLIRKDFRKELSDKKLPPKEKRIIQNEILGHDLSYREMKIDENILNDIHICEYFVKNEIEKLKSKGEVSERSYNFYIAPEEDQAKLIHYLYLLRTNQDATTKCENLLRELLEENIYVENLPKDILDMANDELKQELAYRGIVA